MIRLFFKRLYLVFLFVLCSGSALFAQSLTAQAQHVITPTHASLGEELRYERIVTVPRSVKVIPPEFKEDQWGPFVIKSYTTDEQVVEDKKVVRFAASISGFELGDLVWPTQNLELVLNGALQSSPLPPLNVRIKKTIPPNTFPQLRDIKSPVFLQLNWKPYLKTAFLILLLIAILGYLIYRIWKKTRPQKTQLPPKKVDTRTPYDIAIQSLKKLYAKKLIEKGEMKSHYLMVTDILKAYFSDRYHQKIREMTSAETLRCLMSSIDEQTLKRVKHIFMVADYVKYAKFTPSDKDHANTYERIADVLKRTKPVQKPKEKKE